CHGGTGPKEWCQLGTILFPPIHPHEGRTTVKANAGPHNRIARLEWARTRAHADLIKAVGRVCTRYPGRWDWGIARREPGSDTVTLGVRREAGAAAAPRSSPAGRRPRCPAAPGRTARAGASARTRAAARWAPTPRR